MPVLLLVPTLNVSESMAAHLASLVERLNTTKSLVALADEAVGLATSQQALIQHHEEQLAEARKFMQKEAIERFKQLHNGVAPARVYVSKQAAVLLAAQAMLVEGATLDEGDAILTPKQPGTGKSLLIDLTADGSHVAAVEVD